nr:isoamylase [Ipomoea trifida]
MVSELAGEGAMPLPAPASHAELRRVRLQPQIRRGSLLRRGVTRSKQEDPSVNSNSSSKQENRIVTPQRSNAELRRIRIVSFILLFLQINKGLSTVLFKSNQPNSWSRSVRSVNAVFAVFDRDSWSRSGESLSAELVDPSSMAVIVVPGADLWKARVQNSLVFDRWHHINSWSRFMKSSSRVLGNLACVDCSRVLWEHDFCRQIGAGPEGSEVSSFEMATEESVVVIETTIEAAEQQIEAEPVKEEPENPPAKSIKSKKVKAGSSQYAIQKFIEEKQKMLLSNFRRPLLFRLKKFVAVDKLVKVKNYAVSLVLGTTFAELANGYYRDERRKINARKGETYIQYCFKVVHIEFRRDWGEALRIYDEAYHVLRETVDTSTKLPLIQRFHKKTNFVIKLDLDPYVNRSGDVWHVSIDGSLQFVGYGYRCKTATAEKTKHALSVLYAKILVDYIPPREGVNLVPRFLGQLCKEPALVWSNEIRPNIPMEKLIVYHLNVSNFTKDKSRKLPAQVAGIFFDITEKLQHFKDLGVGGEVAKVGLDMKNLIACTCFLLEQKLVKAWLVDKYAEALRCQKLLVGGGCILIF